MGSGSSKIRRFGSVPSILLRAGKSFNIQQLFGRQDAIETILLSIVRDKVTERNDYKMHRHKFPSSSKTVDQYVYVGDFQEEYEVMLSIGEGAESEKVLLVRRKEDKKKYACKVIVIGTEEEHALVDALASATGVKHGEGDGLSLMLSSVAKQISILTQVDHPNIVKAKECLIQGRRLYFIQELCTGGTLLDNHEKEGEFSSMEVLLIMEQIFDALVYLHERDIIHCDIKIENILLSEPGNIQEIKLIDFGMAEDTDIPSQTRAHIMKGTLQYMAPEILEGENGAFSSMCDVWSAGIVMYVLLFGSFPFEGETREELLESISKGLDQKKLSKIGDRLGSALKSLLIPDPAKRPTSAEILSSSWLKDSHERESCAPLLDAVLNR